MRATISKGREEGFHFITFPHDIAMEEYYKEAPGSRCWRDKQQRSKTHAWGVLPMDLIKRFIRDCEHRGWDVESGHWARHLVEGLNRKLYPYQQRGVLQACMRKRHIFADEMGLGKTPQAIEAIRVQVKNMPDPRVLIVCPAVTRVNWMRELGKWWPGHPAAALWDKSRPKGKKPGEVWDSMRGAPIQIISYGLIHTIPNARQFDFIILDEAHRLQSTSTKWSKATKAIVRRCPNANVYALTATPMPDRPAQVWNIVDILWEGLWAKEHPKWGQPFSFMNRYLNREESQYGTRFTGVSVKYVTELRERLQQLCTRTTKDEVAHLLPPCNVNTWRLATKNTEKYKLAIDKDTNDHKTPVSTALLKAAEEKLEHCHGWLEDAIISGENVCIMTYHREMAKQVVQQVDKGKRKLLVGHIDGNMPAAARQEMIDNLAGSGEQFVLVATLKSVGIGIDLTCCTQVLFLEMAYQPEVMIQALGRFQRLSGKKPSVCTLMVLAGTIDEIIADRLSDKMEAINATIRAGMTESKLEKAMGVTEAQWETMITTACEGWEEESDGYGF